MGNMDLKYFIFLNILITVNSFNVFNNLFKSKEFNLIKSSNSDRGIVFFSPNYDRSPLSYELYTNFLQNIAKNGLNVYIPNNDNNNFDDILESQDEITLISHAYTV